MLLGDTHVKGHQLPWQRVLMAGDRCAPCLRVHRLVRRRADPCRAALEGLPGRGEQEDLWLPHCTCRMLARVLGPNPALADSLSLARSPRALTALSSPELFECLLSRHGAVRGVFLSIDMHLIFFSFILLTKVVVSAHSVPGFGRNT